MHNTVRMQLAKNVKQFRKELGWSKVALAEACGLHRNSINDVESGKSNPTLKVICELAVQLGTTPEKLMTPQARKRVRPLKSVVRL